MVSTRAEPFPLPRVPSRSTSPVLSPPPTRAGFIRLLRGADPGEGRALMAADQKILVQSFFMLTTVKPALSGLGQVSDDATGRSLM